MKIAFFISMLLFLPAFAFAGAFDYPNFRLEATNEGFLAILLSTGGGAINALHAVVRYNPEVVNVKEIQIQNSLCRADLFVEKKINPEKGEVSIICGLPSPGFNGGRGVVAELVLESNREKDFEMNFGKESKMLLNDYHGLELLSLKLGARFNSSLNLFALIIPDQLILRPSF